MDLYYDTKISKKQAKRLCKKAFSLLAKRSTLDCSIALPPLDFPSDILLVDAASGRSILHEAARLGDVGAVRQVCASEALSAVYLDCRDNLLKTPLMEAATVGSIDCCVQLLNYGARVDARRPNGWRPLLYACVEGHAEVAELLLRAGASASDPNAEGATPLHLAARTPNHACIATLLSHGADPCALSDNLRGAWQAAAARGHVESLRLLHEAGAPVCLGDKGALTIAHEAAGAGQLGVLKWMLETRPIGGAGHRAKPGNAFGGITGSQAAAEDSNSPVLSSCAHSAARSLVESDSALCRSGARPGPAASGSGAIDEHSTGTRRIVAGLWVDYSSYSSCSLMHCTADARDTLGRIPLHSAAVEGQSRVLQWMLSCGECEGVPDKPNTPPSHQDSTGAPQLSSASSGDPAGYGDPSGSTGTRSTSGTRPEVVTTGLAHRDLFGEMRGLVDAVDSSGSTAAALAASAGHTESLQLLLDVGADPEGARSTDISDPTDRLSAPARRLLPLKAAIDWYHEQCVAALLRHGAEPEGKEVRGALDRLRGIAGLAGVHHSDGAGCKSSLRAFSGCGSPGPQKEPGAGAEAALPAPLVRQGAASAAFAKKRDKARAFLSRYESMLRAFKAVYSEPAPTEGASQQPKVPFAERTTQVSGWEYL